MKTPFIARFCIGAVLAVGVSSISFARTTHFGPVPAPPNDDLTVKFGPVPAPPNDDLTVKFGPVPAPPNDDLK